MNDRTHDRILFDPVSLAVCIETRDLEILAMSADGPLPATFSLSVTTGLTGMVDSVSSSRPCGIFPGRINGLLQPGDGHLCRLRSRLARCGAR